METSALTSSESRYCPVCEYDLRGNVSGRCPECGTVIALFGNSRLPWIYQRARGGARAYFQTVAMLLFRPGLLAKETEQRVQRRPAHRFHVESITLATCFGAGLLAVIFLMRGSHLEMWMEPTPDRIFGLGTHSLWWLPIYVWTDRLSILIPLLPALYFSLRVSAWWYRRFFQFGVDASERARRRASRIAFYGSGLAPVLMVLGGTFCLMRMLLGPEWEWAVRGWWPILEVGSVLVGGAFLWAFYFPTLVLLARAGKGNTRHALAMLLLYPAMVVLTGATVVIAVFWITGYIALAGFTMLH